MISFSCRFISLVTNSLFLQLFSFLDLHLSYLITYFCCSKVLKIFFFFVHSYYSSSVVLMFPRHFLAGRLAYIYVCQNYNVYSRPLHINSNILTKQIQIFVHMHELYPLAMLILFLSIINDKILQENLFSLFHYKFFE